MKSNPAPKLLVVLVEDDPGTREVFGLALEVEGFVVVTFETAEQALEGVTTLRPAALVTDLTLPGMGGVELARKLREGQRLPGVQFFALTGWDPKRLPPEDVALFRQVFLKPIDIDVVGKAIRGSVLRAT